MKDKHLDIKGLKLKLWFDPTYGKQGAHCIRGQKTGYHNFTVTRVHPDAKQDARHKAILTLMVERFNAAEQQES